MDPYPTTTWCLARSPRSPTRSLFTLLPTRCGGGSCSWGRGGEACIRTIGSRTWRTWTYIAPKRSSPSSKTSKSATWYGLRPRGWAPKPVYVSPSWNRGVPSFSTSPPTPTPAPGRPQRSEPGPILRLELGVLPGRSRSGYYAADSAQPGRRQATVPDQDLLHAAPGVPSLRDGARNAKGHKEASRECVGADRAVPGRIALRRSSIFRGVSQQRTTEGELVASSSSTEAHLGEVGVRGVLEFYARCSAGYFE